MNETGFIVLHRKLLEWKYFYSPYALKLWIYLLLRANWKTGYFLGVEIPRGSLATSMRRLALDTEMDVNTVRKWIKRFQEEDMITVKTANRVTHIFINNYATFQDIADEQSSTQHHTESHTQSHTQRPPNRTNKQINKVTKKQKDRLGAGSSGKWEKPSLMDVVDVVRNENLEVNPEKFFRYYEARKWRVKDEPVKDWKKLLRSWADNEIREEEQTVPLPSYSLEDDKEIDYSTMPGGIDEDDEEGDFENL